MRKPIIPAARREALAIDEAKRIKLIRDSKKRMEAIRELRQAARVPIAGLRANPCEISHEDADTRHICRRAIEIIDGDELHKGTK